MKLELLGLVSILPLICAFQSDPLADHGPLGLLPPQAKASFEGGDVRVVVESMATVGYGSGLTWNLNDSPASGGPPRKLIAKAKGHGASIAVKVLVEYKGSDELPRPKLETAAVLNESQFGAQRQDIREPTWKFGPITDANGKEVDSKSFKDKYDSLTLHSEVYWFLIKRPRQQYGSLAFSLKFQGMSPMILNVPAVPFQKRPEMVYLASLSGPDVEKCWVDLATKMDGTKSGFNLSVDKGGADLWGFASATNFARRVILADAKKYHIRFSNLRPAGEH